MTEVGFLGLGSMGRGMATNLVKAGHEVTVYNRSAGPAEALAKAGATVARTPADAGHGAVAMSMLADDAAVEAVVLGPAGLATTLAKGAIHVSMSSISVALADRLTVAHASRGQRFVSAPVFGRPDVAAAGKLFIAAAGEPAVIDDVRPLFDAIGQRVFVIGAKPSQANLMKLTGNFLITCVIESLAEAYALTEKGGIDPAAVFELLTESLFSAPIYKTYGRMILDRKYSPAGFKMPLGQKDIRLVQQAADALSVPLPLAGVIRDRFLAAIARGDGELDWSAIARRAAEDAGLDPSTPRAS